MGSSPKASGLRQPQPTVLRDVVGRVAAAQHVRQIYNPPFPSRSVQKQPPLLPANHDKQLQAHAPYTPLVEEEFDDDEDFLLHEKISMVSPHEGHEDNSLLGEGEDSRGAAAAAMRASPLPDDIQPQLQLHREPDQQRQQQQQQSHQQQQQQQSHQVQGGYLGLVPASSPQAGKQPYSAPASAVVLRRPCPPIFLQRIWEGLSLDADTVRQELRELGMVSELMVRGSPAAVVLLLEQAQETNKLQLRSAWLRDNLDQHVALVLRSAGAEVLLNPEGHQKNVVDRHW